MSDRKPGYLVKQGGSAFLVMGSHALIALIMKGGGLKQDSNLKALYDSGAAPKMHKASIAGYSESTKQE
jgi:hypothetical protein